ncbi:MAG: hypothetical protein UY50_C0027G0037 [Parcubacteria group bacterium GW2011_GWA2_49_9]|nr:MAG: hypothetical protein UY50_C0027G0037 [Parcubacteria group bacterium GW2011_GWA2_49_9]
MNDRERSELARLGVAVAADGTYSLNEYVLACIRAGTPQLWMSEELAVWTTKECQIMFGDDTDKEMIGGKSRCVVPHDETSRAEWFNYKRPLQLFQELRDIKPRWKKEGVPGKILTICIFYRQGASPLFHPVYAVYVIETEAVTAKTVLYDKRTSRENAPYSTLDLGEYSKFVM